MSETPAGWHLQEDGRERYWDGERWTDAFRTPEQVDKAPAPSAGKGGADLPRGCVLGCGGFALVVVVAMAWGWLARDTSPRQTALEEIVTTCGVPAAALTDEGRTLTVTLIGDRATSSTGTAMTPESLGCILGGTGVSDAVISHISSTRALDGQQSEEWGLRWSARWTFHPDAGLNLTLQDG